MGKSIVTVAVDGPAGSGKSSVSKAVALRCGLRYIDSGAIYRAITLKLLRAPGAIEHAGGHLQQLEGVRIAQVFEESGRASTFLDGENVSSEIRSELIAKNIGRVSDNPDVRSYVNSLLRQWSRNDSIIMDGRDIGTVVFPDATLKIYLDASVDVRAERRRAEYEESGKKVDFHDIKKQIIQRDVEDRSRQFGALIRADDAVYIDTSSMTREEVIEHITDIVAPLCRADRE